MNAVKQSLLPTRVKTFRHRPVPFEELDCVTTDNGRYYVAPDGTKLHSMTTMLGLTSDKEYLEEWREAVGDEAADKEMKRCSVRGEGVHFACEHYVNNEPMEKVVGECSGYVYMFEQIKKELDTRLGLVIVQEIPLYSYKMKVAGRVDLIGYWDGELAVIDFKTSNKEKTKEDCEDYAIQLCGYAVMFYEMFGIRIKKLVNIISTEGRTEATVIEYTTKEVLPLLASRTVKFHTLAPPIPKQ